MILTLPLPPSVNMAYVNVQGRGRVRSKLYNAWIKNADNYLFTQMKKVKPLTGKYSLIIRLPQNMRGDADNRTKIVSDYLVKRNITPDDRHCQSFHTVRADVAECEVEISAGGGIA